MDAINLVQTAVASIDDAVLPASAHAFYKQTAMLIDDLAECGLLTGHQAAAFQVQAKAAWYGWEPRSLAAGQVSVPGIDLNGSSRPLREFTPEWP